MHSFVPLQQAHRFMPSEMWCKSESGGTEEFPPFIVLALIAKNWKKGWLGFFVAQMFSCAGAGAELMPHQYDRCSRKWKTNHVKWKTKSVTPNGYALSHCTCNYHAVDSAIFVWFSPVSFKAYRKSDWECKGPFRYRVRVHFVCF